MYHQVFSMFQRIKNDFYRTFNGWIIASFHGSDRYLLATEQHSFSVVIVEHTEKNMMSHALERPLVGVIMGSKSDWETMQHAVDILQRFNIPYETEVVSAHRTPDKLFSYAASAAERGLEVIIAGAGGAAHLPGMAAAKTEVPVLGVPVQSKALNGMDSLLSIAQMPAGIPVGTLAIGRAGAVNAALLAAAILGNKYPDYRATLNAFRQSQTDTVLADADPRESNG